MKEYQQILIREGVYLPQTQVEYTNDLMQEADIQTSSELELNEIPLDGAWRSLRQSMAQMLPVNEGPMPKVQIRVNVKAVTTLDVELRISSKAFNHTPDVTLGVLNLNLEPGEQDVLLSHNFIVCVHQQLFPENIRPVVHRRQGKGYRSAKGHGSLQAGE